MWRKEDGCWRSCGRSRRAEIRASPATGRRFRSSLGSPIGRRCQLREAFLGGWADCILHGRSDRFVHRCKPAAAERVVTRRAEAKRRRPSSLDESWSGGHAEHRSNPGALPIVSFVRCRKSRSAPVTHQDRAAPAVLRASGAACIGIDAQKRDRFAGVSI